VPGRRARCDRSRRSRASAGRLFEQIRSMSEVLRATTALMLTDLMRTVRPTDRVTTSPNLSATFSDLPAYQAVATRRMQWDALLWQVPSLSLAAQAFLLTISVDGDTSRTSPGCLHSYEVKLLT
jgi:hypothetical protein